MKIEKKENKTKQIDKKDSSKYKRNFFNKIQFSSWNNWKKKLKSKLWEVFSRKYDFVRLRKIENNQLRNDKYNQKIDKRKKTLRSPLNLNQKVLVLAERLSKKDAPGSLYKASTENMPFLIEIEFLLHIKETS